MSRRNFPKLLKITRALCLALLLGTGLPAATAAPAADPAAVKRLIGQADFYVKEFEREVELQHGGEKQVWRSKNDALTRVQQLKRDYPDNPEVEKLFQRTRVALLKSKGDYTEIDPAWTLYRRNEDSLRELIAGEGEKAWQSLLAEHREMLIDPTFPAPDSTKVTIDDLKGRYVVLEDVQYPANQFYGATGEYIHAGKPSTGYYFVSLAGRQWLGPYEAVKRFRREVDTSLTEVLKWQVLGEITDITAEVPQAGEEKTGNFQFGWVVSPVALWVPGHVMARYNAQHQNSGSYAGEERVPGIKEGWYTVKEIPADVTPERLAEIFMTAIKEKNYQLYSECINPERRKTDTGQDLLRYFWDLHQERFYREYVHAKFGKAKITVRKGFDDNNELENFFLDDAQKAQLAKMAGEKIEDAVVESRAFDENGKQVGSPHTRRFIRRGGGRWYVEEYEQRF